MSETRMQSTTTEGGFRGVMTKVWNRGTHCASADAMRGRIEPASDRFTTAAVSGLVAQVIVPILGGLTRSFHAYHPFI